MKNIIEEIKEELGIDISNKSKSKQQYWIGKFRKIQTRKNNKYFKQLFGTPFNMPPLFMK